jgi:hypothetical protein
VGLDHHSCQYCGRLHCWFQEKTKIDIEAEIDEPISDIERGLKISNEVFCLSRTFV